LPAWAELRGAVPIVSFLAAPAPQRRHPLRPRGRTATPVGVRSVPDPLARLRRHRYAGLVEDLLEEPTLLVSTMFGFVTCYLHGRFMLALADKRPPWRGLLVPTERVHHAALRALVPELIVHPVLGKWLYLRDSCAELEASAQRLVALARADDPRIGVEPGKGKSRAKRTSAKRTRKTRASTRRTAQR
jgi:hypothetical protein